MSAAAGNRKNSAKSVASLGFETMLGSELCLFDAEAMRHLSF
jgi:hypothetical protein